MVTEYARPRAQQRTYDRRLSIVSSRLQVERCCVRGRTHSGGSGRRDNDGRCSLFFRGREFNPSADNGPLPSYLILLDVMSNPSMAAGRAIPVPNPHMVDQL